MWAKLFYDPRLSEKNSLEDEKLEHFDVTIFLKYQFFPSEKNGIFHMLKWLFDGKELE